MNSSFLQKFEDIFSSNQISIINYETLQSEDNKPAICYSLLVNEHLTFPLYLIEENGRYILTDDNETFDYLSKLHIKDVKSSFQEVMKGSLFSLADGNEIVAEVDEKDVFEALEHYIKIIFLINDLLVNRLTSN